jgi:glyoxylase-like metal-dependent hydrolase (beta-lactamase superfamily II)/ferredoxin
MEAVARPDHRLPENAEGDLFVDASCIDCATCRYLAPGIYARSSSSGRSYVSRQPGTPAEAERALMALVACPTASIGAGPERDVRAAAARFPDPLGGDVENLGYTSESSFGASSYLIRRPGGNVMVDSPRFNAGLLARIRERGGATILFLTHRDDVADHARWARELGCERVLHQEDEGRSTRDEERRLRGHEAVALAPDLMAIPVPGHTPGSAALLFREETLFSGDHLMGNAEGRLRASRSVCWFSWPEQTRSVERLLEHRFSRVFPGHGGCYTAESADAMRSVLESVLSEMRAAA